MHWSDQGSEGFVITYDDEPVMVIEDPDDMVSIVSACLEYDVLVIDHGEDEDEPSEDALILSDPHLIRLMCRDLLTAAVERATPNGARLS